MRAAVRRIAWCVLAMLALVGIAGSFERAFNTVESLSAGDADTLSPLERGKLEALARGLDMDPASAAFAKLERNVTTATAKYRAFPVTTFLHVLPGALVLALGLLQFSSAIRTRHPKLHRACGRVLLVAAVVAAVSGLFFGIAVPYGGFAETSATTVFGGLMLVAAARAYAAIRRREIATHREWMIRLFAVAIGIAVIRVISFAWLGARGTPEDVNPAAFGLLLWIGWLLTLAVAELWIRATRIRARHDVSKIVPGTISLDQAPPEGIGGVVVAGRRGMARTHERVD